MIWSLTILSCNICVLTYAQCVVTYVQCLVTYAQSVVIYAQCVVKYAYCTMLLSQSNHAFFLFPFRPQKFLGRVEQIFQKSPRRYLSSRKLKANVWIFQIAFSQWIAPLTKKIVIWSYLFRAGLHLHVRKISTLSVKQVKFFAKIS